MTLQELQKQALQLPISDRWQLVQTLLESLQRETSPGVKNVTCPDCGGLQKVQKRRVKILKQIILTISLKNISNANFN